jgi:putative FmdB family regulatory protein
MPTYEYACRDCGEHLEVVQSFKDAPLTECGRCGGSLRKVFSAAGIIFKGSGYYVTDSRPAAGKKESSSDGSSSDTSSSKTSAKESKGDSTAKSA